MLVIAPSARAVSDERPVGGAVAVAWARISDPSEPAVIRSVRIPTASRFAGGTATNPSGPCSSSPSSSPASASSAVAPAAVGSSVARPISMPPTPASKAMPPAMAMSFLRSSVGLRSMVVSLLRCRAREFRGGFGLRQASFDQLGLGTCQRGLRIKQLDQLDLASLIR